jgi:UDPglucose 6-dehydrogenase
MLMPTIEVNRVISKNISIIGLGYVGLCTAIGFTSKGYNVTAVDVDTKKVTTINKAIPPFYEPKLQDLLQKARKNNRLKAILDPEEAVINSDITFITVGTPSNFDGSIDLDQIKSSAIEIGRSLTKKDDYHLIAVKSTVVPGTTEKIVKNLIEKHSEKNCNFDFGLCMNPEFLREGSAVDDAQYPDRIVIGEYNKKSGDMLCDLYSQLHEKESVPILRTNLATAELIKYANNAFLATKISYINTIANICEKVAGADVTKVAQAIGLDQRINPRFLQAGLGYGGSCFPKDVKALISFSINNGYSPKLLQSTHEVNEMQANNVIKLIKKHFKELKDKKVAILGLAFKPDTNDMREARSIPIIENLLKEGVSITVYDPVAVPTAQSIFKTKINYAPSAIDCLKNAECCIIVTEWDEFKKLKPEYFERNMKKPILIDGRRIYDPNEYNKKLIFEAIGLGTTKLSN